MAWKPIVAGLDRSPEAVRAAVFAARIAKAAPADGRLVHAVGDPWLGPVLAQIPFDVGKLNQMVVDSARAYFASTLRESIPNSMLQGLDIQLGHPAIVLSQAVRDLQADLLVLGGKPRGAGHWWAGSTAHQLVRLVRVPLLVTGPSDDPVRRVLAAVDLSPAAEPTLEAATRLARLFDAQLRVFHTVEPLPVLHVSPPGLNEDEVARRTEDALERVVWPLIEPDLDAERVVRRGPAPDGIAEAVAEWSADVVVVGSHGKRWLDRLIIGSTTERLLTRLPAALLVVPVPRPSGQSRRAPRARRTALRA